MSENLGRSWLHIETPPGCARDWLQQVAEDAAANGGDTPPNTLAICRARLPGAAKELCGASYMLLPEDHDVSLLTAPAGRQPVPVCASSTICGQPAPMPWPDRVS